MKLREATNLEVGGACLDEGLQLRPPREHVWNTLEGLPICIALHCILQYGRYPLHTQSAGCSLFDPELRTSKENDGRAVRYKCHYSSTGNEARLTAIAVQENDWRALAGSCSSERGP